MRQMQRIVLALARPLGWLVLLGLPLGVVAVLLGPWARPSPTSTHMQLLTEAAASVSGKVVDEQGEPFEGALVTAISTAPGYRREAVDARTDSSGRFAMSLRTPGTYSFRVRANGYFLLILSDPHALPEGSLSADVGTFVLRRLPEPLIDFPSGPDAAASSSAAPAGAFIGASAGASRTSAPPASAPLPDAATQAPGSVVSAPPTAAASTVPTARPRGGAVSPVSTAMPSPTPQPSPMPTGTPSPPPASTDTPVPTPTETPAETPTPFPTPTDTPTPSPIPTDTPTPTPIASVTPTPSPTPTKTPRPVPTPRGPPS
jgi:hypothetical protein